MSAWIEKFINKNEFSNPQIKLTSVKKLVLHWTANFGGTAQNHFDYFNNLKDRYASAHIFVDKTQALNVIDLNHIAYHANDVQKKNADGSPYRGVKELLPNANLLSIGVEMCVEKDGTFHTDTIAHTVDVFVELCKKFNLDPLKDIVRHYDVTAKNCPAPWIANDSLFQQFKQNVNNKLHPVIKPVVAEQVKVTTTVPSPTSKVEVKKYLSLPSTADSWRVYPLNKVPMKGNEIGSLNPKKFNGLKYEILGNPQKDVYVIQTASFGKVQIFATTALGVKFS